MEHRRGPAGGAAAEFRATAADGGDGSGFAVAAGGFAGAEAEADCRQSADDGIGAIKLWAVYNRYTQELRQVNDEKFRLVQEYGQQWGTMTNDQALMYIRRWLEVHQQVQALRLKYVPEVSQALPGKKAAKFFQLDRRISMMMDLQLASQLPLVAGKVNAE
jgi:hypothetical protein